MTHLDGNVLAGAAAGLFALETTTMTGQCDACQDVATLGQALVYGGPMGFVARCRRCEAILLVIVELPGRVQLDMRGLRWLQGSAPAAAPSAWDVSEP
jgi:hypothetical protein